MKKLYLSVIFILLVTTLFAQSRTVELTHYLLPEFTPGTVIMKDRSQNFAVLNYNLLSEEMLFNQRGKILAIGADIIDSVDSVIIGERRFVVFNGKFIEVLMEGDKNLYAEYKCSLIMPGTPSAYGTTNETASTKAYSALYSGGMMYELKLPDGFKIRPYINYWIKQGYKMEKFVNIKQLSKILKAKDSNIKSYCRANKVDFKNPSTVRSLVDFLNQ